MPTHDPNNRDFKQDRPPKGMCQTLHGWTMYEDENSRWIAQRDTHVMEADTYDDIIQMVLKRPA